MTNKLSVTEVFCLSSASNTVTQEGIILVLSLEHRPSFNLKLNHKMASFLNKCYQVELLLLCGG